MFGFWGLVLFVIWCRGIMMFRLVVAFRLGCAGGLYFCVRCALVGKICVVVYIVRLCVV